MFLHYTHPDNVDSILRNGLTVDNATGAGRGLEWVLAYYETNPVYLTLGHSEFIEAYLETEWADYSCFEVDTAGVPLVADIPSLIDKGAKHDSGWLFVKKRAALEPLLPFADCHGSLEIEHLLEPETHACSAAIAITRTAACLSPIEPHRLNLRTSLTNRSAQGIFPPSPR